MKHLVVAALMLGSAPANAGSPTVVRPLSGYACTRLILTEQQALNPKGSGIWIVAAPRSDARRLTAAASVVFAKSPLHIVDGFAEVVQINGQPGWIAADKIRLYEDTLPCVPSVMSNGLIGAAPG